MIPLKILVLKILGTILLTILGFIAGYDRRPSAMMFCIFLIVLMYWKYLFN